jgi:hypothetical protein
MRLKPTLYLSAMMVVLGAAQAQAPPGPATPMAENAPPAAQRATECAPTKSTPQRGPNASEGTTVGQANEALGDKLARSNGVLCPPTGVDPEMRAPTPETGDRPLVRPPGSGNPSAEPK